MEKQYYRISECLEGLAELEGQKAAGIQTRFKTWGDNITYKIGYHCTIASPPASGKSYFVLSEMVHLAEQGYKSLIFSPEMGSKSEITALLIHLKTGKSIYLIEGIEKISQEEKQACTDWLDKYFIILDNKHAMSVEDIYSQLFSAEKDHNWKITYLCIDNINDTKEPEYGSGRQDLNVEQLYNVIRTFNKEHMIYTFILTHSASQGTPIVQNNIRYYPPITPREVRSGEAIFRKCFLFLALWRPPFGLEGEDGPYKENEVHVIVLKAKPANTAKKGFVGRLFFDWKKAKYSDQPRTIQLF